MAFNGTIIFTDDITLEMVEIKAGSFLMGSPDTEAEREPDEEQHKVTLTRDYWLGKFAVTQIQYEVIMGNNPSYFKGDHRPVEQVSWNDAKAFCDKLNEIYATQLPEGYQFDLPTEAQWEYACRAGTATAINSGENMQIISANNSPELDCIAWYSGNCGQHFDLPKGWDISSWNEKQYPDAIGGSHFVGEKQFNRWGL